MNFEKNSKEGNLKNNKTKKVQIVFDQAADDGLLKSSLHAKIIYFLFSFFLFSSCYIRWIGHKKLIEKLKKAPLFVDDLLNLIQ